MVVNNKLPPFDDEGGVLDTMEGILHLYQGELQIQPGSIKGKIKKPPAGKPRVSIQFSFKNGMEVDLLPATNIANITTNEIFAEIAKDPEKNYYMYHTSLVSTQLSFMKSQDSFTHSLIRVAKVWFKTLDFGDKNFFGGSTLMEFIGCAAAEEENKSSEVSMFRALQRVLQMVSRIDSLELAFRQISPDKWGRISPSEINAKLVPKVIGTTDILMRKCFIVDPANPYYDQLGNKDHSLFPMLKNFAVQFMNKLQMTTILALNFNVSGQFYIDKLFETKLTDLTKEFPSGATQDFLCGYAYPYSSRFPDMKVRNENVYKRIEVQCFVEAMKWNLVVAVNAAINGNSENVGTAKTTSDVGTAKSTSDVVPAVNNVIKTCLNTGIATASNHDHENYDVTLTIPYRIGNDGYAVKCSLRW